MSAVILAPIPLAAIWFGEPWLAALAVLAAGVMAWEWGRLCQRGALRNSGYLLICVVVAAVIAGASRGVADGIGVACLGAVVV